MSYFKIENVTYMYDKFDKECKKALSGVSFDVEKEDFVAIIGHTGSGKSTLVSLLNGLLTADSGNIYFENKNIYDKDFDLSGLRFKCGVVFQYPEYQLFSETVLDDICFSAIKKGLSKDNAIIKANEVMRRLGIDHLANESPFILSGGERRKVAFAGVLVTNPEILILDEPEAGLDAKSKNELFDFLKFLNREKHVTIIFITHDLDDAVEYARKVLVLNEGKLEVFGKPYEVFSNEKFMSEYKFEMPNGVKIAKKLKEKGIDIDIDKIGFDNIVEYMGKL